MKRANKIIYIILILILAILFFLVILQSYDNYLTWKTNHNYLKQQNPEIESWMTINMISKNFNISYEKIFSELNVNKTNVHVSLDRFCKQYRRDCGEIINNLNSISTK
jgi:uncharacterized protein YneF (UPF0154 family)